VEEILLRRKQQSAFLGIYKGYADKSLSKIRKKNEATVLQPLFFMKYWLMDNYPAAAPGCS
jgi:hypothetical protein